MWSSMENVVYYIKNWRRLKEEVKGYEEVLKKEVVWRLSNTGTCWEHEDMLRRFLPGEEPQWSHKNVTKETCVGNVGLSSEPECREYGETVEKWV